MTRLFFLSAVLAFLLSASPAAADDAAVRRCVRDPRPFDRYWNESVTPAFEAGTRGTFTRPGGLPIVYRHFPNRAARRSVVLFPGYAESSLKHKETAYVFGCLGYSVWIMSWTGMGESGRAPGLPSPQIVHADSLAEYIADATAFLEIVRARDRNPLYVFAHSTGGLLVSHVLARRPAWVRAAVLSAPLFELNLGDWPYLVALNILRAEVARGRAMHYAIGYDDWAPGQGSFDRNQGTRDRARYDRHLAEIARHRDLWMGGPSNGWILTILGETTERKLASLAARVRTPLLVYQAGADGIVRPGGQDYFCARAPRCRLRLFPNAYHELYREVDEARVPAYREAHAFFSRH